MNKTRKSRYSSENAAIGLVPHHAIMKNPNYPTLDAADHRCENGATGLVVSDKHAAASDVVAPCTATAWMGMKANEYTNTRIFKLGVNTLD